MWNVRVILRISLRRRQEQHDCQEQANMYPVSHEGLLSTPHIDL
jgi:hypothetical protein